jgi:hypothetical protein
MNPRYTTTSMSNKISMNRIVQLIHRPAGPGDQNPLLRPVYWDNHLLGTYATRRKIIEPMSTDDWPFSDPTNVAVFTVADIVGGRAPILLVSHEEEDGGWQFLTGDDLPPQEHWKLVGLSTIVAIDPSVKELADLPLGYSASRASSTDAWQRWKNPAVENEEA